MSLHAVAPWRDCNTLTMYIRGGTKRASVKAPSLLLHRCRIFSPLFPSLVRSSRLKEREGTVKVNCLPLFSSLKNSKYDVNLHSCSDSARLSLPFLLALFLFPVLCDSASQPAFQPTAAIHRGTSICVPFSLLLRSTTTAY